MSLIQAIAFISDKLIDKILKMCKLFVVTLEGRTVFGTPNFLKDQKAIRDNEELPPEDRLRAVGTIRFTWKLELVVGDLILLAFAILFPLTLGWWGIVLAIPFVYFALKLSYTVTYFRRSQGFWMDSRGDLRYNCYMISVVVPAYNEERLLPACLDSLAKQKTSRAFEVIVVDNNSSDRTAQIANSYKKKIPDLRVVFEEKKGRGQARYTGFAQASGAIILSCDADTIVPSNWIEVLVESLKENIAIAAVTGPSRIADCGWFTNQIFNIIQPSAMRLYRFFYGHYWLNGFNFAIRKSVYQQTGGFDRRLGAQEDVELALRVSKIREIQFLPQVFVITSGRRFQKHLFRGLGSYIRIFFQHRFLHKEVDLSDSR